MIGIHGFVFAGFETNVAIRFLVLVLFIGTTIILAGIIGSSGRHRWCAKKKGKCIPICIIQTSNYFFISISVIYSLGMYDYRISLYFPFPCF